MDNFGSIFSDKMGMGDKSSDIRSEYKREGSRTDTIHSRFGGSSISDLFTLFNRQKKMATIKIGWVLYNLLGWPPAILSFLSALFSTTKFGDIILGEIARPYKDIILIVGIIFLLTKVAHGIEKWISHRIDNKRKAFELKKEVETYLNRNNSQSK